MKFVFLKISSYFSFSRNNRSHQSVPMMNTLLRRSKCSQRNFFESLFSFIASPIITNAQPQLLSQSTSTYTINLSVEIRANRNLTTEVIDYLQQAFSQWRLTRNVHGNLSTISSSQLIEQSNNDISDPWDDYGFNIFSS